MPDPYNYQLNVPSPTQAVLAGVQAGDAIRQNRALTAQENAKTAALTQQTARQQAFQADIAGLGAKPTSAGIASIAGKYPEFIAHAKETYDLLDKNEKQARLDQASATYSALAAGDSKYAAKLLNGYADAYNNANEPNKAKPLQDLAKLVELHPDTAQTSVGAFLAGAMGPDKFTESFSALEKNRRETATEGATLTKAQAEAHEAAVKSGFAESNAVADLTKKGWDITKLQSDITLNKQNSAIAAAKVAIESAKTDVAKQALQAKLEALQEKREQAVQTRAAAVTQGRQTIDNAVDSIDDILKTPIGVIQSATGTIDSHTPTFNKDTADFEEKLKTIQSQQFLTQFENLKNSSATGASGLGALSEAEGQRLISGVRSLTLRGSAKLLTKNLAEVRRLLLKSRVTIGQKYGAPETVPDTPSAAPDANSAELDSLIQQYTTPAGGE